MAKKQIIHKSMRGRTIDMELLRKKNELTPAMGNARVNARGDELGPGGKIIRKREQVVKDHYKKTARNETASVKAKDGTQINVEDLTPEELELFEEDNSDDEWIEDENGNFVPKGE